MIMCEFCGFASEDMIFADDINKLRAHQNPRHSFTANATNSAAGKARMNEGFAGLYDLIT